MPTALTIAGSDSSAGAGVQADLKTFAAHGVYGTCAITAVTAQNTVGVRLVHELPPDVVTAQIEAVADDIEIQAVKIGMLAGPAIAGGVAARLRRHGWGAGVRDPGMTASRGGRATPTGGGAPPPAGMGVAPVADARQAAARIRALGPRAVVVKGGHLREDEAVDVLLDETGYAELRGPRVIAGSTHGTGCTFAAAIAANLALGTAPRP